MSQMLINDKILLKEFKTLKPEQQQQVIDFISVLKTQNKRVKKSDKVKSLWQDLNINIDEHDITEIRQEMLLNFSQTFNDKYYS
jgi:hypothetical protein